jgi:hypothetical protein
MRWLLLILSGCGFQSIQNINSDAGSDLSIPPGSDLAIPPGADLAIPPGSDLAIPPGADLAIPPGADLSHPDLAKLPCNNPLLLVSVENLGSGGGKVAAFSLGDGSNPPSQCNVFSAQGNMTAQPRSVAMVAGKLAVEGVDAVQLIEPASDTLLWSKANNNTDFPFEVFALGNPDNSTDVAAVWASTSVATTEAHRFDAWSLSGSLVRSWTLNTGDIPLGLGIVGMTSFPGTPTHLLAADPGHGEEAWDVDPWAATKTSFIGTSQGSPVSIFADTYMGNLRIAWTDTSGTTGVIYHNDPNSGLFGPISCASCTLLHVVPDPTLNTRFLGLCDGPSPSARRVVRFESTGGSCDDIFDGAAFGTQSRLSRLGISQ